ncbi:MAG: hypothetical protein H6742_00205 [Alphaproteobacteria bacterium]|nr:hypothetical protein [Alphaproteobacteria bacterium]
MAEQEHKTPGATLSERLAARSGRAERSTVGTAVAARFGLAPAAEMSTLSIRPYLQAMSRLAQSRQRREARLSAMLARYEQRMQPSAFRRLPGFAPKRTGLAALLGDRSLSTSDFVLPERGDIAPAAEEAVVEASPAAGTRYTSSRSPRPARSAWLSTPWSPAKVARTPKVVTVPAPELAAPVARASTVERRPSALQRAASRSVAVTAPGNRLARAVDAAAPQLERSARGRAVAQQLRAIADLPQAEQAVQVRRILRRAGATTRTALEPIEAVAPQVSPTQLAADRLAPVERRRGLRPVMSHSPGMQALVPAAPAADLGDAAEAAPAPRVRPAATAAARLTERTSPWLSASPVRRARAARAALSASPVAALRAATAPPAARASQVSAARVRTARSASPVMTRSAETSVGVHTGAGRTPRRRATPAASATSSSARGADDGPGPSGPADAGTLDFESLGDSTFVPSPAPTARAFQRLAVAQEAVQADAAPAAVDPGAALRLADDGATRSRRGGFELGRSAAGVFVPAQVLAAAQPVAASEPAEADAAPTPRVANVPTPARRAEYVTGLESTAHVSRTPSSRHAAGRAQVAERPRSVLPAAPGRPTPTASATASASAPARRLSLSRRADGAFVATRAVAGDETRTVAPSRAAVSATAGLPVSWAAARMTDPAAVGSSPRRRSLMPAAVPALLAPAVGATSDLPAEGDAPTARAASPSAAPRVSAWGSSAAPVASAKHSPASSRAAASVRAADRSSGSPLVGAAAQRATRADSDAVVHRVETRHRPNPVAYARAFGLSSPDQVVVQTEPAPASSAPDAASAAGAPAASRRAAAQVAPGTPASVAAALQRMESRATAAQTPRVADPASVSRTPGRLRFSPALSLDPVVVRFADPSGDAAAAEGKWTGASSSRTPSSAWLGAPTAAATAGGATGAAASSRTPGTAGPGARVVRTASGAYVGASVAGSAQPVDWAGARTARTPGQRASLARDVRTPRGRFDGGGTYRVPGRGAPNVRRARVADDFTAVRPDGFGPAAAGGPESTGPASAGPATERASAWFTGPSRAADTKVRPSFAMTTAAAHAGMDSSGLPVWARRASGEPLIHREEQFVDALARASTPEDIVRVIYKRAEAGALSAGASGLPAPVLNVIHQIRSVADAVSAAPPDLGGDSPMDGPGSDLEVVRRARGETRSPSAASAPMARGSLLRVRGSASRRSGVGADQISKLSKKLQQLILLAEKQRGAARQEVRMAEDSAAARAEGSSSPGQAEGGNNEKVDIDALGREVLEVVTLELEMRKQRSQEGSDEFGWW